MQRGNTGYKIYLFIIFVFVGILIWYSYSQNRPVEWNYTSLTEAVKTEPESISGVTISQNPEIPTGKVYFRSTHSSDKIVVNVSDVNETVRMLEAAGITVTLGDVERESYFMTTLLPVLLIIFALYLLLVFFNHSMAAASGGGRNMSDFGKSRAQMIIPGKNSVTFADVAGLREEKEDLEEIVDFLKDPKKYLALGARIPKGVLLVGAPGTGKTLLAKAVAGEANTPFFSISGSDFVEMFVGVGASRVRDLFAQAKVHAPCIVFIDEIDAVGRRRGTGMGGGHDEREQTLNQLLVEMDGFTINEGIIVMAATNRLDILDPALLRPGRFDRNIAVSKPDVRGREEILKVHAKNKPLADDVDLTELSRSTIGYTGADLENLMNESAISAAKDGRKFITKEDIEKSYIKMSVGTEKKSRIVAETEKKITAYHEAGHAILLHLLPNVGPVHTVSIIPTGAGAAGYTMPLPEKEDLMFHSKSKLLNDICADMGGRIAEDIIFGDVTTGATHDIKHATAIARRMVTEFGMSEAVGVLHFSEDDEVVVGRDLGHVRTYSEDTARKIDEEVKRIVDECYAKAYDLIKKHENVLHSCANLLLEKEKIMAPEFEALFVSES
ncbi:MAG: ATP-dependent zinc metalloprotease FtsH [Lachnospiraceae bacterium]|nr:ATP-dependent zinc metalloprotease FtsH [Lachnospiraceae bacterium]